MAKRDAAMAKVAKYQHKEKAKNAGKVKGKQPEQREMRVKKRVPLKKVPCVPAE